MAVRWGTRPDQEVIVGTLETLPRLIHEHGLKPPGHHHHGRCRGAPPKLSWYEKLPLFGQSIVVTRTREQAGVLSAQLRQLGAEVIELPTIEIQPAGDYAPARPGYRDSGGLRLADLHQRQRRALFSGRLDASSLRLAGHTRQDLRHRAGHPRRTGGLPSSK